MAAGIPGAQAAAGLRVVVVGAGAFGGWTALDLLRAGADVTLVDAWGPGNSRASSGGETRLIRASYGRLRLYSEMVVRSLELWKANEADWNVQLFFQTGLLLMTAEAGRARIQDSVETLRALNTPVEAFGRDELERRYPQIHPDGIDLCGFEPGAGYLLARRGCQRVLEAFVAEGGDYRQAQATPGSVGGGRLAGVTLSDGETLEADRYVFACGPWLGSMFPEFDPPLVRPTRQEVFYFGTPPGRPAFTDQVMPTWILSGSGFYGVPGSDLRGFKLADDRRGEPFDPTDGDRTPSAEGIARAREFMETRFPGMRGAPLLGARVCQYEQSADGDLIMDTHPDAENLWIVGGGSGHGYKLGPAVGEMVRRMVLGQREREPTFALARLG